MNPVQIFCIIGGVVVVVTTSVAIYIVCRNHRRLQQAVKDFDEAVKVFDATAKRYQRAVGEFGVKLDEGKDGGV